MKPKVALVKDGFLPAGSENKRGRLSADAINRLKELALSGWDIDGYSVVKGTPDPTAAIPLPGDRVEKVSVDPNSIADVPDETRPESDWNAFVGNKSIGMRTVCNTCHSSLTYCHCQHPRVWIDYNAEGVVVFKPTNRR